MGKSIKKYTLHNIGEEVEEVGRRLRTIASNSDNSLIDKEEIKRIVGKLKKYVKTLEVF
ncbi:MAG: hypothetical protein HUJ88_02285 [Fusobacterium necrophorum]|nr:hypothetical protein [Fusobacterium necrophorum]